MLDRLGVRPRTAGVEWGCLHSSHLPWGASPDIQIRRPSCLLTRSCRLSDMAPHEGKGCKHPICNHVAKYLGTSVVARRLRMSVMVGVHIDIRAEPYSCRVTLAVRWTSILYSSGTIVRSEQPFFAEYMSVT